MGDAKKSKVKTTVKNKSELTAAEWTIMKVVWEHQPCAARTVRGVDVDDYRSGGIGADELIDRKNGLAFLDQTLADMTPELRTTFTLYELEEMTMAEISALTDAPLGTVASRLRRARVGACVCPCASLRATCDRSARYGLAVRQPALALGS